MSPEEAQIILSAIQTLEASVCFTDTSYDTSSQISSDNDSPTRLTSTIVMCAKDIVKSYIDNDFITEIAHDNGIIVMRGTPKMLESRDEMNSENGDEINE